jgi:transcription elongation factor Elf1
MHVEQPMQQIKVVKLATYLICKKCNHNLSPTVSKKAGVNKCFLGCDYSNLFDYFMLDYVGGIGF